MQLSDAFPESFATMTFEDPPLVCVANPPFPIIYWSATEKTEKETGDPLVPNRNNAACLDNHADANARTLVAPVPSGGGQHRHTSGKKQAPLPPPPLPPPPLFHSLSDGSGSDDDSLD